MVGAGEGDDLGISVEDELAQLGQGQEAGDDVPSVVQGRQARAGVDNAHVSGDVGGFGEESEKGGDVSVVGGLVELDAFEEVYHS